MFTHDSSYRFGALASLLATVSLLAACGGGGGEGAQATAPDLSRAAAAAPALLAQLEEAAQMTHATHAPGSRGDAMRALAARTPIRISTAGVQGVLPLAATPTARTFYIDSQAGSDSNDGSAATAGVLPVGPWRSLAKLAAFTLNPGDTVRLVCGRTWNETLKVNTSGTASSPITVTAHPTGCINPPIIDGSTVIAASSWAAYSGSIYRAPLNTAPQLLVASAGPLNPAHHPNRGYDSAQPNSLYLRNATPSDSALIGGRVRSTYVTTGTDLRLPGGASITVGTSIRIRTNAWVIDETTVSAVNGSRLSLASPTEYPVQAGWGYFLLGRLWMLDSPGEWFYDATTKYIYVWMPNSQAPTVPVYAAQLATGVDLQARSYVQLLDVSIKRVGTGINMRNSTGVVVRNIKVEDTVGMGIDAATSNFAVVESSSFLRTGSNAISGLDNSTPASNGMRVVNNTVTNAGVVMNGETVVSVPRRSYAAIRSGMASIVASNVIRDSGNIGIKLMAGSIVSDNYVRGACTVLDDCAAIYTSGTNNNSQISNNIIEHTRGAVDGKAVAQAYSQGQGIYLDEYASGVTVTGNTVTDADNGIQLHLASNNTIQNNKLYSNRNNQIWLQETKNVLRPSGDVFGNIVIGNQIVPTTPGAKGVRQETSISTTVAFAQFDWNRYFDRLYSNIAFEQTPSTQQEDTLLQWKTASSASTGAPRSLDPNGHGASEQLFATYTVAGPNIVPGGSLSASIAGWTSWNQTPPYATLVREPCTPGYCARYIAGGSQSILSTPNFQILQGHWYRISVDLMTGTDNQQVLVFVRRGGGGTNGYERLSNISMHSTANRTWKRYSFVFQGTKTVNVNDPVTLDKGARVDFQIQIGQTLNVANVEIVPITAADATTRTDLLLNSSNVAIQIACPVAATAPASCVTYARFADDTAVTWPFYLPARSSEIVYTRDSRLIDSDADGIPNVQDTCPATVANSPVNSQGCSFSQRP